MKKKEKRYYWMKLTEDFMLSENGPFDFLMTSSPNGARYVVLYQMLCLKTINTCGVFVTVYGEIVVKLTINKIKKDCKYFSEEEIVIALELFKKIGLVIEDEAGLLEIKDHASLIGSETDAAQRMRKSRLKKSAIALLKNECNTECNNVTYRYKDTRYLDITSSNGKDIKLDSSCSINNKIIAQCNTECNTAVTDNNDDNDDLPSPLKEFKGKIGEGVLLTDEQFELLCEKLSMEELDLYMAKMSNMVKKGYQFGCSHYKFILKMVEEDRRT